MLGEAKPTASSSPVVSIRGAGRPRPTGVTRGFSSLLSGTVMAFDMLAVAALLYYFTVERTGGFASPYVTLAATTAVLMPIVYRANDVSHRMRLGGWLLESSVLLRASGGIDSSLVSEALESGGFDLVHGHFGYTAAVVADVCARYRTPLLVSYCGGDLNGEEGRLRRRTNRG